MLTLMKQSLKLKKSEWTFKKTVKNIKELQEFKLRSENLKKLIQNRET